MLNNRDGTFLPALVTPYTLGASALAVRISTAMAVGHRRKSKPVAIQLGHGDGTFAPPVSIASQVFPLAPSLLLTLMEWGSDLIAVNNTNKFCVDSTTIEVALSQRLHP